MIRCVARRRVSLCHATSPRHVVTWKLNFAWNASRARERTGCSFPFSLSLSLFLTSVRKFLRSLARSSRKNGLGGMCRECFFRVAWYGVTRTHTERVRACVIKGEARLTPIRSANRRSLRHLVRCNGASNPRGRATERRRCYFGIAREKEECLARRKRIDLE